MASMLHAASPTTLFPLPPCSTRFRYMAQTNTYKARCSALDQTRLNTDPRVQDWASIAGTRRSLPTNVPDGASVSVNRLK